MQKKSTLGETVSLPFFIGKIIDFEIIIFLGVKLK